ncbi:MAG: hypothetical protein L0312_08860 [Acidobacteria bacterium]|nr:hypothetical protein [Acidobacteriota bacterium]
MISEDQHIIRYLLDKLSETERSEVTRQIGTDTQYAQLAEAIEEELLDAYVKGQLSREDRNRFENHYLSSAERRSKLEFSRAFLNSIPRRSPIRVEYLKIAALCLLTLSAGLFFFQRPDPVVSSSLRSGNTRGRADQTLEIPSGAMLVELHLYPDSGASPDQARLVAVASEQEIERQRVTLGADGSVVFRIPAALLSPGDYLIFLEANGNTTASFFFSLKKK